MKHPFTRSIVFKRKKKEGGDSVAKTTKKGTKKGGGKGGMKGC